LLARPYGGAVEIAGLLSLYAVYELVRGFGDASYELARDHAHDIIELERSLGVYVERPVQELAERVPGLPATLGALYIVLHFAGTLLALIWIHRRRHASFALVRNTLVVSTALALIGYILYPAAPPRLAGVGFADTVTHATGLNLSSDLLGSLYNPFAAVPSLHFGYSLLVGAAIFALARNRAWRLAGAAYPALMLLIIVATGNHFLFDAAAGGAVTIAGWWLATRIGLPAAATRGYRNRFPDAATA
jgi:hypothetical protein